MPTLLLCLLILASSTAPGALTKIGFHKATAKEAKPGVNQHNYLMMLAWGVLLFITLVTNWGLFHSTDSNTAAWGTTMSLCYLVAFWILTQSTPREVPEKQ